MIRYAEAVLAGHPDKFADQIADRILEEAYSFDDEAYAQVEVGVWSDSIWLSGGVTTRRPFTTPIRDLIVEVGRAIGYTPANHIDVERYRIDSHICFLRGDPRQWTNTVNDQSICIGWAGYDALTHLLPPEQFLVHAFRRALVAALREGLLAGEGPDGKLMVRVREDAGGFALEQVLCTLQHRKTTSLMTLMECLGEVLSVAYAALQKQDVRWVRSWADIDLLMNPNGPLVQAGSDGDNGQTGRKLVMDFYGPRVPLGGGAISGKDVAHIDRVGAYAARRAAIDAVCSGARTCMVTLVYGPNIDEPLDVCYVMDGRGTRWPKPSFGHAKIRKLGVDPRRACRMAAGDHFVDSSLPWNNIPAGGLSSLG